MLKYEQKFNFDKRYNKHQSSSFLRRAISLIWGIAGYVLLYYLIKSVLVYIPDFQPWNDVETWFSAGIVNFVKADLVYFICGLIFSCYGSIRLSKITVYNHSAKNEKDSKPKKLLVNGYYAKVRHPMYGTFIILQAGFMLSLRSFVGMLIALIIIFVQYANAALEEKKQLIPIFGEEYALYIKNVNHMLLTRSELIVFTLVALLSAVGFIL